MKTCACLCALSVLLLLSACARESTPWPSGACTGASECLNQAGSDPSGPSGGDGYPIAEACLNWHLEGGILTLSHEGAVLNCCPGKILAGLTVDPGRRILTLSYREEPAGCHCLCPYRLDYQAGPLPGGAWMVHLDGPDEQRDLPLVLVEGQSGQTCWERGNLQWE